MKPIIRSVLVVVLCLFTGCASPHLGTSLRQAKTEPSCRPRFQILTTGFSYLDYYNGAACHFIVT